MRKIAQIIWWNVEAIIYGAGLMSFVAIMIQVVQTIASIPLMNWAGAEALTFWWMTGSIIQVVLFWGIKK